MTLRGFDYRRQKQFPGWGARREWPPVNPVPDDPNTYTYVSSEHVTEEIHETGTSAILANHTVDTFGVEGIGYEASTCFTTTMGSFVMTANLGIWVPFTLGDPVTANRFFWNNGGAVGGSTDVGVFDSAGTVKYASTGATANAGVSAIQQVNITDIVIPAGVRLWMCLTCDSGVQQYVGKSPILRVLDSVGVRQQTGAYSSGLPNSITFALNTLSSVPHFGFTSKDVI